METDISQILFKQAETKVKLRLTASNYHNDASKLRLIHRVAGTVEADLKSSIIISLKIVTYLFVFLNLSNSLRSYFQNFTLINLGYYLIKIKHRVDH